MTAQHPGYEFLSCEQAFGLLDVAKWEWEEAKHELHWWPERWKDVAEYVDFRMWLANETNAALMGERNVTMNPPREPCAPVWVAVDHPGWVKPPV
jgi:hypothetical protein